MTTPLPPLPEPCIYEGDDSPLHPIKYLPLRDKASAALKEQS